MPDSHISGKRFDLIVTDVEEQAPYAIEIKLVRRLDGLEDWFARTDDGSKDHTVYRDIEKLQRAMKENSEEYYNCEGIMIIVYHGTKSSDPEEENRIITIIQNGLSMILGRFVSSGINAIYRSGRSSNMKAIGDQKKFFQ